MPKLSQAAVSKREALATKLFREGKSVEQAQAALRLAYDGVAMSPSRILELFCQVQGLTKVTGLEAIKQGLKESAEGKATKGPSYAKYAPVIRVTPQRPSGIDWYSQKIIDLCAKQDTVRKKTGQLKVLDCD
jgi:hypothetical protein